MVMIMIIIEKEKQPKNSLEQRHRDLWSGHGSMVAHGTWYVAFAIVKANVNAWQYLEWGTGIVGIVIRKEGMNRCCCASAVCLLACFGYVYKKQQQPTQAAYVLCAWGISISTARETGRTHYQQSGTASASVFENKTTLLSSLQISSSPLAQSSWSSLNHKPIFYSIHT
jgi:hypothetical protein